MPVDPLLPAPAAYSPGVLDQAGSRLMRRLLLAALVLLTTATQAPAADAEGDLFGVWRNPHNTVHLEIRPCGGSACGYVVWAAPKAQADARRGSGKELIGQQLLRDFAPTDRGWRGKVFVPDLNVTLGGAVRPLDGEHLQAKGCLISGLLCKSQVWSRVAPAAS